MRCKVALRRGGWEFRIWTALGTKVALLLCVLQPGQWSRRPEKVMENVMTLYEGVIKCQKKGFIDPQKMLSFLKRYCHCWHLLRISLVLEAIVKNCAQVFVLSNQLYIPPVDRADSSCIHLTLLAGKGHHHLLVFSVFNSRASLSHYSTNSCSTEQSWCEGPESRDRRTFHSHIPLQTSDHQPFTPFLSVSRQVVGSRYSCKWMT